MTLAASIRVPEMSAAIRQYTATPRAADLQSTVALTAVGVRAPGSMSVPVSVQWPASALTVFFTSGGGALSQCAANDGTAKTVQVIKCTQVESLERMMQPS